MLKLDIFDKDILTQVNNQLNNCLMIANKNMHDLVGNILSSKHCDKDIIHMRNSNYETSLMHACKYSYKPIPHYLLYCDEEDVYKNHTEHGSALLTASRYQPKALKYLLDWDKMNYKLLNCKHKNYNILQIACIYNANSVKYAFESKWNMKTLLTKCYIEKYSEMHQLPLILACKYQPEAVKYIIDSKYASLELLSMKSPIGKICIHYALECQPKALLYISRSEYCTNRFLKTPYKTGYTVLDMIKLANVGVTSFKDIEKKIPLFNTINTVCDMDDPQLCNICYTFKSNTCLVPCIHTTCSACAIKVKKCPMCKKMIKQKEKIF